MSEPFAIIVCEIIEFNCSNELVQSLLFFVLIVTLTSHLIEIGSRKKQKHFCACRQIHSPRTRVFSADKFSLLRALPAASDTSHN